VVGDVQGGGPQVLQWPGHGADDDGKGEQRDGQDDRQQQHVHRRPALGGRAERAALVDDLVQEPGLVAADQLDLRRRGRVPLLRVELQVRVGLPVQRGVLDPLRGQDRLALEAVGVQAALLLVRVGLELVERRPLLREQVGQLLELAEREPLAQQDAVERAADLRGGLLGAREVVERPDGLGELLVAARLRDLAVDLEQGGDHRRVLVEHGPLGQRA
jgi:hypothetical protein